MAGRWCAASRSGVRKVDHAVGRLAGKRRILVEARTPMNLAVLRPVFERLLTDSRLRVHFTGPERADLAAAFQELGVAESVVDRGRVRWRRFDLYVNADPWEAVWLRRVGRQLNFFHGVAGKYNLDCPTGLPAQFHRYDRSRFPTKAAAARMSRPGSCRKTAQCWSAIRKRTCW